MKIKIPKVVRPIRLSDYAPEFGEQEIGMWVNPSKQRRLEFYDTVEESRGERVQIAALVADEDAIERHTKNSQLPEDRDKKGRDKNESRREFAADVLTVIPSAEDLDGDEKAERLTAHFKRIEELGDVIYAWYAEMWSQGQDYEEWTGEEVRTVAEAALDTDPGLWDFLQESSLDAMSEYRTRKKVD